MIGWAGAKTAAKLSPVLIPVIGVIDVEWAISIALGLLAGVVARIGLNVRNGKSTVEILRDTGISMLILGGSLLATLYIARLMNADNLTVAVIGFAVAWRGIETLNWLDERVFKIGNKDGE